MSSIYPWINSSRQLSLALLPHYASSLVGLGETMRNCKVRKLMRRDKVSVIGKAKAEHTSKAK